jgi:F-type H+-transporting ATPase subunit b
MELVTPDPGLLFWMTITFLLVLFILTKFAWKPIMKALKDRESSIEEAIQSAENARRQMDSLKADNEKLLQEARLERDKMMKEAKEMKESIISQARKSADEEGRKMIAAAKEAIDKEKNGGPGRSEKPGGNTCS